MLTATAQADRAVASGPRESALTRVGIRAQRPAPAGTASIFRICFGLLVVVSTVRFVARGWVEHLYLRPEHHLTYPRFEWVRPLPGLWMYALMAMLAVMGVGIALGWRTRWCAAAFTLGFAYTELIDAGLYLNHYWFVTLAGLLIAVLPAAGLWSLDGRRGRVTATTVPVFVIWALGSQIAVVYVFAGLAKLNTDWLLHGLPLRLWLADRTDVPVIGFLLDEPFVAIAASWFGVVFDLTIVGWLLWRRSRPYAYVVVVAFHLFTAMLFQIGMFPWVMMSATIVFFDPDWPSTVLARFTRSRAHPVAVVPSPGGHGAADHPRRYRVTLGVLACLAVIEVALPLRHVLAPGDVRVTEEGYYLSWRVMVTEKAGVLDFRVRDPLTDREWVAEPRLVLTDWQAAQASVRPDLLLAAAHLVDRYYREELGHDVEVRAESFVSVNGRAAQRLIDPAIDLSEVSRTAPLHEIVLGSGP